MHSSRSKLIAIVTVLWFAISARAFAQSNPRYIRFAGVPSAVKGALYAPDAPQKAPHVAILVVHRASNFMNTFGLHGIVSARFSRAVHESALG
jgi:hypothetical protein